MRLERLEANEDFDGKQNSSKASAYSLHVLLGDIDLIAAIPSTMQSAEKGASVCTLSDCIIRKLQKGAFDPCRRSLSGDASAKGIVVSG